ncbi:ABL007Wp [Eremothecium gossypii ATCC 10895]|uniref:ABL007Wp n=1 Tax=Eremothecium gossypii (strain ATCC 10895 / CBS 109.51 / FGSC 9923 / NRRL Y-1056) TaxID=284811 RepID=Q75DM4_EREGS|nr:ABL007Wp [Eremothecium gossypii ATCC 10895]AAS50764.1 ABL007Wp [Eremothecium gossypii ATCC 10895]AEY95053.1 FABL007Wp [Eremothecium gossypii FDAG1]
MSSLLVSLTHFCDKHGPKLLVVTQCAKSAEECEKLLLPNYPSDSYCDSCHISFPTDQESKSIRSTIGERYYVSTHYSAVRYQYLTALVKKIFSEETVSYDGSPLLFYDHARGLNLAMGFKLEDPHARGNERRYCLVLTVDLRERAPAMEIVSQHWKFISGAFENMIEYIKQQRRAELLRVMQQGQVQGTSNFSSMVSGTYLRGNNLKIPKNITELTNDRLLFVRIHKWNAFILDRLGGQLD